MKAVLDWISTNYSLVMVVLLIITAVCLIIFLIALMRLSKITKQYKYLLKGSSNRNLEQLLINSEKTLEQVIFKLELLDDRLVDVEEIAEKSIQRVGLVRFNAFSDIGGDLSYALALLDQKGNGVVISSIFGRDDVRTYAKPVKAGRSSYKLSEEEEAAIQISIKENLAKNRA